MSSSTSEMNGELRPIMRPRWLPQRRFPYRAMLTEHDVLTWQGTLVRLWSLDHESAPAADAPKHSQQHAALPAQLNLAEMGEFVVWLHRIDRAGPARCGQTPKLGSGRAPATYLSLVFRPARNLQHLWRTLTHASLREIYAPQLITMAAASEVLEQQLPNLQVELLGVYFRDGYHCNEVFDFLSYLFNGVWMSRPLLAGPLQRILPLQNLDPGQRRQMPAWQPRHCLHPFPELAAGQQLY